jgi:hypothetical protein
LTSLHGHVRFIALDTVVFQLLETHAQHAARATGEQISQRLENKIPARVHKPTPVVIVSPNSSLAIPPDFQCLTYILLSSMSRICESYLTLATRRPLNARQKPAWHLRYPVSNPRHASDANNH